MCGTRRWARIQRPAPTCQLVSPSMKTRSENPAVASNVMAAIAAMAKSRLAETLAGHGWRSRETQAAERETSAMEIGVPWN